MTNPITNAALTRDDVETGVRFRSYVPFNCKEEQWTGTFISSPYESPQEDWLVDIRLSDGGTTAIELCAIGIGRNSSGQVNSTGRIAVELHGDEE